MKTKFIVIFLISFSLFSCQNKEQEYKKVTTKEDLLKPINYNFEELKLQLNSSLSDSLNKEFWKWNHMASNNGSPDTLGTEYYMNLEQPIFEFDGLETLPALYALTEKGKLIAFSAKYIFNLPNQEVATKNKLFDKLGAIDLLQDKKVRQELIEKGIYRKESDHTLETVELEIPKEKYGYDSVTYEIKNATE